MITAAPHPIGRGQDAQSRTFRDGSACRSTSSAWLKKEFRHPNGALLTERRQLAAMCELLAPDDRPCGHSQEASSAISTDGARASSRFMLYAPTRTRRSRSSHGRGLEGDAAE